MKKLALLIALVCSTAILFAQTTTTSITDKKEPRKVATFKAGDIQLNAGIGIVPTYVMDENTTALMPPVSLTLGLRMSDHFVLSAFAGMTKAEAYLPMQRDGSEWYVKNESTMVGVRAEMHTARRDNFDIYGGAMIGYNMPTIERLLLKNDVHGSGENPTTINANDVDGPRPFRPSSENEGQAIIAGFVGASWYVTPNVSIFGEVGYGVSIGTIGLGYKF